MAHTMSFTTVKVFTFFDVSLCRLNFMKRVAPHTFDDARFFYILLFLLHCWIQREYLMWLCLRLNVNASKVMLLMMLMAMMRWRFQDIVHVLCWGIPNSKHERIRLFIRILNWNFCDFCYCHTQYRIGLTSNVLKSRENISKTNATQNARYRIGTKCCFLRFSMIFRFQLYADQKRQESK